MTFLEFTHYIKEHLNLELNESKIQNLQIYLKMLQEWNELFNLTAIVDEQKIIEKHFLDSLLPVQYFDLYNKTLIDIGTGAGFPGLVIAIVFDQAKVTLLEPNSKKVRFLKAVVAKLSLNNVVIINDRAETQTSLREKFDYGIARAVKPLNILLELAIPLLKVQGIFIAMKSSGVHEEIKQAKKAFTTLKCKVHALHEDLLPTDKDVRINLLIIKHEVTPNRYPRLYNQISTKPL